MSIIVIRIRMIMSVAWRGVATAAADGRVV